MSVTIHFQSGVGRSADGDHIGTGGTVRTVGLSLGGKPGASTHGPSSRLTRDAHDVLDPQPPSRTTSSIARGVGPTPGRISGHAAKPAMTWITLKVGEMRRKDDEACVGLSRRSLLTL